MHGMGQVPVANPNVLLSVAESGPLEGMEGAQQEQPNGFSWLLSISAGS